MDSQLPKKVLPAVSMISQQLKNSNLQIGLTIYLSLAISGLYIKGLESKYIITKV